MARSYKTLNSIIVCRLIIQLIKILDLLFRIQCACSEYWCSKIQWQKALVIFTSDPLLLLSDCSGYLCLSINLSESLFVNSELLLGYGVVKRFSINFYYFLYSLLSNWYFFYFFLLFEFVEASYNLTLFENQYRSVYQIFRHKH